MDFYIGARQALRDNEGDLRYYDTLEGARALLLTYGSRLAEQQAALRQHQQFVRENNGWGKEGLREFRSEMRETQGNIRRQADYVEALACTHTETRELTVRGEQVTVCTACNAVIYERV